MMKTDSAKLDCTLMTSFLWSSPPWCPSRALAVHVRETGSQGARTPVQACTLISTRRRAHCARCIANWGFGHTCGPSGYARL